MRSPFVYFAGDRLATAELTAACLDGHLVPLGEAFVPADVVETCALRAATLHDLLGDTLAATHQSAAWVWGVIEAAPRRHTVQRAVERRIHHVLGRMLVYRDPLIPAADLVTLGGAAVSTPPRTLADLARSALDSDHDVARVWAQRDAATAERAIAWLDRARGAPRKVPAARLLRLACTAATEGGSQDEVTR
ncbi:hypothetical protein [Microbacterium sp. P04]|uniref:hypothetical protein n=1 Tax=Microbacterium sp. P04 TaxID=3366947 RepID=UPI003745527B